MSINSSGICGIVGKSCQKEDLERIAAGMRAAKHAHNREIYIDDAIGFCSFSSEDNGQNVVHNEKETIVAIVNGEISNAAKVKSLLESRGHRFSSDAEHEVLVHLFEESHTNRFPLQNIEGAFSFALWDSTGRKLTLGTDKFGMRVLYYTSFSDSVLFASELKGLANHPDLLKRINPYSVSLFFSYFYVPTEDTLIYGVKKVLPASCKIFTFEKNPILSRDVKYLKLDFSGSYINTDISILCEEMYKILLESVKEKLKNNPRSVGVSLGGGLDSGTVSSLLRKLDRNVVAFIIAMEGGEQNAARLTAEYNGSKVDEISLSSEDYIKNISDIVKILDEPIFDWALVLLYLIGQRANKRVDVLFTGDGGDETFWGYPWVPRQWFDPLLTYTPLALKRISNTYLNSKGIADIRKKPLLYGFSIDSIYERTSLPASEIFFVECLKKCDPRDSTVVFNHLKNRREISSLRLTASINECFNDVPVDDDLLRRYHTLLRINFAQSGAGVRSREVIYNYYGMKCAMPFINERVIRFGYKIPSNLKQPTRFETKYIMRKMISRYKLLPERVARLRKTGIGDPFFTLVRRNKSLVDFMFSKLDEGYKLGLIRKDFIDKARKGLITPGRCFGIALFGMWYQDFILKS